MKIIKTRQENKTILEIKFTSGDFTIIFALIGLTKFIIKTFTRRK